MTSLSLPALPSGPRFGAGATPVDPLLAMTLAMLLLVVGCRGDVPADGAQGGPSPANPASTRQSHPPGHDAGPVRGVLGVGTTIETDPDQETDHEGACAPQGSDVQPMQLLDFRWTSGIDQRNPKDKLRVTKPGDRVYAYLRMRNRSGRERCLRVQFRISGKKRPPITLKVGKSWSWRTWAYSTSRSDDRGFIELLVSDDQGYEIVRQKLPLAVGH